MIDALKRLLWAIAIATSSPVPPCQGRRRRRSEPLTGWQGLDTLTWTTGDVKNPNRDTIQITTTLTCVTHVPEHLLPMSPVHTHLRRGQGEVGTVLHQCALQGEVGTELHQCALQWEVGKDMLY